VVLYNLKILKHGHIWSPPVVRGGGETVIVEPASFSFDEKRLASRWAGLRRISTSKGYRTGRARPSVLDRNDFNFCRNSPSDVWDAAVARGDVFGSDRETSGSGPTTILDDPLGWRRWVNLTDPAVRSLKPRHDGGELCLSSMRVNFVRTGIGFHRRSGGGGFQGMDCQCPTRCGAMSMDAVDNVSGENAVEPMQRCKLTRGSLGSPSVFAQKRWPMGAAVLGGFRFIQGRIFQSNQVGQREPCLKNLDRWGRRTLPSE